MPSPRRVALNVRLLLQSALQHAIDDPALLVVQVSRRLPMGLRVKVGRAVHAVTAPIPGAAGAAALGAFMAGEAVEAQRLLANASQSRSTLHGEVSVLLDRPELLAGTARAATRARAAWNRGEMSEALRVLDSSGQAASSYGRRLHSELELLSPGHHLQVPVRRTPGIYDSDARDEMRVLHLITNSLPHTQSGYSLRTHRILRALAACGVCSVALTRTGYPVMVGKIFADEVDIIDGIEYHRSLPSELGDTPQQRLEQEVEAALALVRELRPHVLHATTDYRNALVAQAVSEASGIPWVLEVRGLMEQTWIASRHTEQARLSAAGSEKVNLVQSREGELAASAAAVVTLSGTMADELVARGVDPGRITLVPNGVDEVLLRDQLSAREARRVIGIDLPEEAFAVGAVSAMVDYEGFEILLRAAARLIVDPDADPALRDTLHVVLAGDGTAAPGLADLALELGIADRVHFPGRVPAEQARRWVESLDVVTIPRLDRAVSRAVTPQKPVEALALGRPVILSDLPALRETVTGQDGTVCGVLVEAGAADLLAAAILELAGDQRRRDKLVDQGRRVARERTWDSLVQRYERMYETVTARSAKEYRSGE